MGKLDVSEIPVAAPVVRAVHFRHPVSGAEHVLHLRRPTMAGYLAVREKAREDIAEWVTVKTLPDGSKKRPNVYTAGGVVIPMSSTLWASVNGIFALQCDAAGSRLPEAERYTKKELVEFSVKMPHAFIELANAADELFDEVASEAKNLPGVSADAGSSPSPETDANTP